MSNTIGWGKGNNSIGWGNVGTNGFGSIYNRSNSGETNLVGQEVNVFQEAAVAYSLRDLGLGLVENVVRVRRSSDNVEQDFTASQITDGTLTSFCGAGDGFVSIWYDQKGFYNATQTFATIQPKIVNAGALILEGGKPALKFPSSITFLATNPFIIKSGASLFGVFKSEIDRTSYIFTHQNAGSSDNRFALGTTSGNVLRHWLSRTDIKSSSSYVVNQQSIITSILDTNNSTLEQNNTIFNTQNTNVGDTVSERFQIGNNIVNTSTQFQGTIQECILFNTNKFEEKEDIKNKINSHYAIY